MACGLQAPVAILNSTQLFAVVNFLEGIGEIDNFVKELKSELSRRKQIHGLTNHRRDWPSLSVTAQSRTTRSQIPTAQVQQSTMRTSTEINRRRQRVSRKSKRFIRSPSSLPTPPQFYSNQPCLLQPRSLPHIRCLPQRQRIPLSTLESVQVASDGILETSSSACATRRISSPQSEQD